MIAKIIVLWDLTPCRLIEIYRFLEEIYAFLLRVEEWLPERRRARRDERHSTEFISYFFLY
jgi:hypothetical protein